MRRCQARPYEGTEPYIFASYSHRDSEKVFPIIEQLARDGYRVWYDEGIEPGEEWPESIAAHLNNCHICIAFISPRYMESHNCWRELNYALQQKKQFLIVFIEETEMSAGMQMQLSVTQSIIKYQLPSDEEFFRKLYAAKGLSECREKLPEIGKPYGSEMIRSDGAGVEEVPWRQKEKNKERGFIIALCAAAAVVFVICVAIFVLLPGSSDSGEQTKAAGSDAAQAADSSAETGAEREETSEEGATEASTVALSDNLFDYMLEIEGVVYQFPCETSDFTDNGWVLYHSDYENKTVAGKSTYFISIEYETTGYIMALILYNPSGNVRNWKECEVSGIDCYSNLEYEQPRIILPGNLELASVTTEDLVEAYGEPTSSYDSTYCVQYKYDEDPSSYTYDHYVEIYIENESSGCANGIYMENCSKSDEATTTNEEVPDYLADYTAPTELGDDDLSGILEIDGDLYRIPCPITEFLNNGWELASDDVEKVVYACNDSYIVELVRGTEKISLSVFNGALYQTIVENCYVKSIYVSQDDVESMQLPSGVTLGMSDGEVEEILVASSNTYDLIESSYTKSFALEGSAPYFSLNIKIDPTTLTVDAISIYRREWDY